MTLTCRQGDSNFPVAFKIRLDQATGFKKQINIYKELVEVDHITGWDNELRVHSSSMICLGLEK